jgi:sodium-independent sulfate anion transporter 11
MVEFISAPVISCFCSAAALTVSSTQVKGLFGLKRKGSSFIEIWRGFFENITKCNPWDSARPGLFYDSNTSSNAGRLRIFFL